jgi:hypothetical protein
MAAFLAAASASMLNTARGNTVGVLDPSSANDIDIPLAAFSSSSGTWGSGGSTSVVSLATFRGVLGTAYANTLGGVEDFEGRTIAANAAFTVAYGANTLSVSAGSYGGTAVSASEGRVPVSGTNQLTGPVGTGMSFNLALSNAGDKLTGLGFAWIERNRATKTNFVTVTVTLDNGDTVSSIITNNTDTTASNEDAFFGFLVPTDRSITLLTISTSQSFFNPLDDLGFIINGGGGSAPATVLSFASSKTLVVPKEPFTLSWTVAGNPTSLTLDPGNINVLPLTSGGSGSLSTNATATGTNTFVLTAVNAFGSGSATTSVAVVRTLVNLLDPRWDANDLDKDAVFSGGTGSGNSAALVMGKAAARQFFGNAYLAGQGGVENFETRAVTSGQPFYVVYGASDSLLNITGQHSSTAGALSGGRSPTSGATLLQTPDGINASFNFALANPGDALTQVGLGIIERNRTTTTTNGTERVVALMTATATLDNGDTITSTNLLNTDAIDSDEDTFVGFSAPAGRSITNLGIVVATLPLTDGTTPGLFYVMDDLAFAVNGGGSNPTPAIFEYRADKTIVVPKEPVTLNWLVTTNLTSLVLNPGGINALASTDPGTGVGSYTFAAPSVASTNAYILSAANGSGSLSATSTVTVVDSLVQVIDPSATSTNENDLDKEAIFNGGTGLGNDASLVVGTNDFRVAVSNAFASGLGGVENFETRLVSDNTTFYIPYGPNADHLIVSGVFSKTSVADVNGESRIPLSGTQMVRFGGAGNSVVFNLGLDNPNAKLTHFGFGLIERLRLDMQFLAVTATAWLDNGDTIVEFGLINTDLFPSNEDTWFGFKAPAGHGLTNVSVQVTALDLVTPVPLFPAVDDLAFVVSQPTVPRITSIQREPATGHVTLTWTSDASVTYRVEAAGTVTTATPWPVIAPSVPSGGTTTSYTDTSGPAEQRFYRVKLN